MRPSNSNLDFDGTEGCKGHKGLQRVAKVTEGCKGYRGLKVSGVGDLSVSAGLRQAQQAVVVNRLHRLAPSSPPGLIQAGGCLEGVPPPFALPLLPHYLCQLLQCCHCWATEVQQAQDSSQARVCLHPSSTNYTTWDLASCNYLDEVC